MRKIQQFTITVVAFALILPTAVFAISSPPLPAIPLLVYGSVTIDGQLAPMDTGISAEIEGVEVAVATMLIQGKYFIEIPDGKANEDKTIVFKVDGIVDNDNQCPCVNIATIPTLKFDLAVTTPSPDPSPSPPPSPPSGGSGSYTPPTSTTPPTPLSEAAQAVDTNTDNKIDILDFNILVVNWGKTESGNTADFDNNGTVDVFDFNLLMTHWTG